MESAKDASAEFVSRQRGEGRPVGRENRNVRRNAVGAEEGSQLRVDEFLFGKEGDGLHAALQSYADHFKALGDENAFLRFKTITELRLCKSCKDIELWVVDVVDMDYVHGCKNTKVSEFWKKHLADWIFEGEGRGRSVYERVCV